MTNFATACFIVKKDTNGDDVVFSGCVNGEGVWGWDWDKMVGYSADVALDLLKWFGEGHRIVAGHAKLGPKLIQKDHKMYAIGCGVGSSGVDSRDGAGLGWAH